MTARRTTSGLALVAASMALYRRILRPWHTRWGATDEEVALDLPGDELVAEPAAQATRAITIDAPCAEVWPWIVQLGADRGGFYTYDALENLFGLGIHSADEIVDDWQDLEVGDVVYGNRARTGGWYVVDLLPGEALVLQVGDLAAGRPVRRDEKLRWEFLWTFALRATPDGHTRLIVRERTAYGSRLTAALMAPVDVVSFVMTRGTMRGIKSRVEAERRGA